MQFIVKATGKDKIPPPKKMIACSKLGTIKLHPPFGALTNV